MGRAASGGSTRTLRRRTSSPGSRTTRSPSPPQTAPSGSAFSSSRSGDAWDPDPPGDDLLPDVIQLPQDRGGHVAADPSEPDTAVPQVEDGVAAGPERAAREPGQRAALRGLERADPAARERPGGEPVQRVAHRDVRPAQRARQDVAAQIRLVDVDADPPDALLPRGIERAEPAVAGDVEQDPRALGDLVKRDRPAFGRVREVVRVGVEQHDARVGALRPRSVADDPAVDTGEPVPADRADNVAARPPLLHQAGQVAGEVARLLAPEDGALDVLRWAGPVSPRPI